MDNPYGISEEKAQELGELYDQLVGTDTEETPEDTEAVVEAPEAEAVVEDTDETEAGEAATPEEDAEPAEDESNTAEGGDAAAETGEIEDGEEPTLVEEPAKYSVVINGDEREVTLEELTRGYQTMQAANEKFQAAAAKEKELDGIVQFAVQFDQAFQAAPDELFAQYVEMLDDPNTVIVSMIERAAAIGKLHPQLVELFGIDDLYVAQAQAELEKGRRTRVEAAQAQATAEQPDSFGYLPSQYDTIVVELLDAAGLTQAAREEQAAFIDEYVEFRNSQGIANPYIAFARWKEQKVLAETEALRAEAARTAAAAKAAKQAAQPKRIPGASAASGQVPAPAEPEPTADFVDDHYEAAALAWERVMGQ